MIFNITNGADSKSVHFYILDYITKAQLKSYQILALILMAEDSLEKYPIPNRNNVKEAEHQAPSLVFKCLSKINTHKERSGPDVALFLWGYGDSKTDQTFVNLYLYDLLKWTGQMTLDDEDDGEDAEDDRFRENFQIAAAKDSVHLVNQHLDYQYRSGLEDVSIYDFVSLYYKKPKITASKDNYFCFTDQHPQHQSHCLMQKGDGIAPATPNVIGPNFHSRQQNAELFCQMFMLLFKPWTCIDDLKTETTWPESMDSWAESELSKGTAAKLTLVLHNCESMSEGREQQKKEHQERARLRKEQGHTDSKDTKNRFHNEYDGMFRPPPDLYHSVDFVKTMNLPQIKDGDLFAQEALNSLFGSSVFVSLEERERIPEGIDRTVPPTKEWKATVVSQLQKQQEFPEKYSSSARRDPVPYLIAKYKLNQNQTIAFTIIAGRVMNEKSPQLIMYLSGEGGTGKSEVIKAVTELFQILGRSDKLKKAACTGTAAGNIDGVTLAHIFDQQINVTQP